LLEFVRTVIGWPGIGAIIAWATNGLRGFLGFFSVVSGVAIIGSSIALVIAIIAYIVLWPVYRKKQAPAE